MVQHYGPAAQRGQTATWDIIDGDCSPSLEPSPRTANPANSRSSPNWPRFWSTFEPSALLLRTASPRSAYSSSTRATENSPRSSRGTGPRLRKRRGVRTGCSTICGDSSSIPTSRCRRRRSGLATRATPCQPLRDSRQGRRSPQSCRAHARVPGCERRAGEGQGRRHPLTGRRRCR